LTVSKPLSLLAVLAHPDDESLGIGGTIAKYASEGVDVHLVTATRGEAGRFFPERERPSNDDVGRVREAELRAAATALGIRDVRVLGIPDGGLDQVDPDTVLRRLVACIREVRPAVAVTFDPFGAYGHPDHIAISQLTSAAIVAAADPSFDCGADSTAAHRVSKLYFIAWSAATWAAYEAAFKKLVSRVGGEERRTTPWPDWAITTKVDTSASWETVWRAVQCHQSQIAVYGQLATLDPVHHEALWGSQTFYRAHSLVNGGRCVETDPFDGLR
jgi:LmbE family N-acetylglucosaminyl deacetylase